MADKQLSYDYIDQIRDLSNVFETIVKSKPALSALIGQINGVATNPKHEWLEDSVAPKAITVTAIRAIAGVSLVVTATAGTEVGSIFSFKTSTGVSRTVQLKVDAIVNATTFTVSVYGGTTDEALAVNDIGTLISVPKVQATNGVNGAGQQPTTAFNYTQIMDVQAMLSRTALNTNIYGVNTPERVGELLDYQVKIKLQELAYQLNSTIIHGTRVIGSGAVPASMGGILYFMGQATGNKVDGLAGAVTSTMLNDALQLGLENGGDNLTTLVCNFNQARKISGFNTAGTNPLLQVQRDDQQTGSVTTSFLGDIPIGNGGTVADIIVDQNFPEDKIAIIDKNKIGLVPLQNSAFKDKDATTPGFDGVQRRIIGEYTLQFKNANESHVLIENITV